VKRKWLLIGGVGLLVVVVLVASQWPSGRAETKAKEAPLIVVTVDPVTARCRVEEE
jgi:hypothetical protein